MFPIGSSISDCNSSKRSRTDSSFPSGAESSSSSFQRVGHWDRVPAVLQCEIHTFLDPNGMSLIETLNKNWQSYAKHTWTCLGAKSYPFSWREAQEKINPTKWNYLLSSALADIVAQMSPVPNKDYYSIASRLWAKYQYLMNLFPSFNCYAKMRLSPFVPCSTLYPSLEEVQRKIFEKGLHKAATSDALLHVLIELENAHLTLRPPGFINALFSFVTRAIENNVACTSFLITQAHVNPWQPRVSVEFEQMAIASSQKGDHRTLEALIERYSLEDLQRLKEKHPSLPPLLHRFALQEMDWSKRKVALKTVIKAYGKRVTPEVLSNIAFVYFKLERYEKSDKFYMQVIKICEEAEIPVPNQDLAYAALIKSKLAQYIKAEDLYTQVRTKCGENVPSWILSEAAFVKSKLEDYGGADDLYTQARTIYGADVPVDVLTGAAFVKAKRGDYVGADDLYTQARTKYGTSAPLWLLADAAYAKLGCLQYEDADKLYTEVMAKYMKTEGAIPSRIITHAAKVKYERKQYEEADKLYTQAITEYVKTGKTTPPLTIANAADVKFALKQHEEADKLYTQAMAEYEKAKEAIPFLVIANAAAVKYLLQQYEEADRLYTRVIAEYEKAKEIIPLLVIANAAIARFKVIEIQGVNQSKN